MSCVAQLRGALGVRRRALHRRQGTGRRALGALLAGSGVALLSLTVVSGTGLPSAGATTFAPVGTFYVADTGANQLVSVTHTATKGSSVTLPSGSGPVAVALSANGTTAWVANETSGKLSKVDTATGTVSATVTLGASSDPVAVAVDPYTTDLGPTSAVVQTAVIVAEKGATKVVGIDPTTTSTVHSVTLTHPDAVAVSSDGSAIDVLLDPTNGPGTLEVLSGSTLATTRSVVVGAHPTALVNLPGLTGGAFYVASAGTHDLECIVEDNVPCASTLTFTLGAANDPVALARSPGGTRLVVAEKAAGKATVVDRTSTHSGHQTTLTVATADGVAVSGNNVAAVSSAAGKVSLLSITSATSPTITQTVTGFTSPAGIAAAPAVAPTASFTYALAAPGSPTTFDASGSTPGTSPIASYTWTFGDGTAPATTTTPTVTHTYATPLKPPYAVTLTVKGQDGTSTTFDQSGQSTIIDGGSQATATEKIAGFLDPTRAVLAYVTQSATGYLSVIDTQPLTAPRLLAQIPLQPKPTVCNPTSTYSPPGSTSCAQDTFPEGITSSPTRTRMYVDAYANGFSTGGAIDVVDATTNSVIQVISTTSNPMSSAVSPDGKTLYVVAEKNGLPVLDVVNLDATPPTVTAVTLPEGQSLPGTNPSLVAVGDGGKKVVVAAESGQNGRFDVFSVATTGAVTATPAQVDITPEALGVTVNPRHTTVAYGIQGSTGSTHAVSVLTLLNPTTTPTAVALRTGDAGSIAADPNGITVAVGLTFGPGTFVAPLAAGTATPRTLTAGTPVALPDGSSPDALAFLPSGTGLYAVDTSTTKVTVLDTVTRVVATVSISSTEAVDPMGVAFGQAAAPHTTPPTTTTIAPTTTTTTLPTPTTTIAPATTTTVVHAVARLHAITAGHGLWQPGGSSGMPWGIAGGALALAGGTALLLMRRRRGPAR